jgi:cytochrome P450
VTITPFQDTSMAPSIMWDSPAMVADPFAVYERLRREAPVCRTQMRMGYQGDADVYALSRYQDCADLTTNERMRRTVQVYESLPVPKVFQLLTTDSMIVKDQLEHSRPRKLASRTFSRKAIARMSDRIDAIVGDLLDGFTPASGSTCRPTMRCQSHPSCSARWSAPTKPTRPASATAAGYSTRW